MFVACCAHDVLSMDQALAVLLVAIAMCMCEEVCPNGHKVRKGEDSAEMYDCHALHLFTHVQHPFMLWLLAESCEMICDESCEHADSCDRGKSCAGVGGCHPRPGPGLAGSPSAPAAAAAAGCGRGRRCQHRRSVHRL